MSTKREYGFRPHTMSSISLRYRRRYINLLTSLHRLPSFRPYDILSSDVSSRYLSLTSNWVELLLKALVSAPLLRVEHDHPRAILFGGCGSRVTRVYYASVMNYQGHIIFSLRHRPSNRLCGLFRPQRQGWKVFRGLPLQPVPSTVFENKLSGYF